MHCLSSNRLILFVSFNNLEYSLLKNLIFVILIDTFLSHISVSSMMSPSHHVAVGVICQLSRPAGPLHQQWLRRLRLVAGRVAAAAVCPRVKGHGADAQVGRVGGLQRGVGRAGQAVRHTAAHPGQSGQRHSVAGPEARVHPVVDERVEAGVAHGQPVRAEPQRRQPAPLAQPRVVVPRHLQRSRATHSSRAGCLPTGAHPPPHRATGYHRRSGSVRIDRRTLPPIRESFSYNNLIH